MFLSLRLSWLDPGLCVLSGFSMLYTSILTNG